MHIDEAFRLGETTVRLHGTHPLLALVVDELAPLRSGDRPMIHVHVTGGPLPEPPRSATTLGPVTVAGDVAWFDMKRPGFRFRVAPGARRRSGRYRRRRWRTADALRTATPDVPLARTDVR